MLLENKRFKDLRIYAILIIRDWKCKYKYKSISDRKSHPIIETRDHQRTIFKKLSYPRIQKATEIK